MAPFPMVWSPGAADPHQEGLLGHARNIHFTPRARFVAASAAAFAASLIAVGIAPAAVAAEATVDEVQITAPASVDVGDTFSAVVSATAAADVFAHEVFVEYDETLLAYVDATYPDGGFGSASASGGEVTVSYTRLGSSPGLGGDLDLATLEFEAIADGDLDISVSAVTLIGTEGEQTDLAPEAAVSVEVIAVTPAPTPVPTDSPAPTTAPTAAPGDDDDDDTTGVTASVDDSGDLASTGGTIAGVGIIAAVAAAAIVGGVLLVRHRKGATR